MKKICTYEKKLFLFGFYLLFSFQCMLPAQVTIGSEEKPNLGMLLDLKEKEIEDPNNLGTTASKGLGLPRVELKNIRIETDLATTMGLEAGILDPNEHIGMLVYNVGKNELSLESRFCPGIHVWDGKFWIPLTPYSEVETRIKPGENLRGFIFLDQNSSNWPVGLLPSNYPLGYVGTFTDSRDGKQYTYGRFYVGLVTKTYTEEYNCLCDPDAEPEWIESAGSRKYQESFIDGLWMTEHLKATVMPDGTTIPKWSGMVNDIPLGPAYIPPSDRSEYVGASGILYNWYAATNMENPSTEEQAGLLNDDVYIQGVCPDGWRLPSDQEWTDLERATLKYSEKFSTGTHSYVDIDYGTNISGYRGGGLAKLGGAMISGTRPTQPSSDKVGTSRSNTSGGFDMKRQGQSYENGNIISRPTALYAWTSSSSGKIEGTYNTAWRRGWDAEECNLNKPESGVYRVAQNRNNNMFFVRCIKK